MFLSVWKYFTKHVSNTVLPTDIIELFQTSGEKYYIQTWAGYLTVALGLILDSLKAKGNSGLLLVILTYIWIDITWIGFQEIFRKSLKSKTKSSYFSKPELSNSLPRSVYYNWNHFRDVFTTDFAIHLVSIRGGSWQMGLRCILCKNDSLESKM